MEQRVQRVPSIVVLWWLVRAYVLFAVCFVLGGGYIALVGVDGGLSEAGGTISVLSGWLLWRLMMVPLIGAWGLLLGVVEWLFLRRRQPSARLGAVATGALAAVAAIGGSVWFSGLNDASPISLTALGPVVWVAVGASR